MQVFTDNADEGSLLQLQNSCALKNQRFPSGDSAAVYLRSINGYVFHLKKLIRGEISSDDPHTFV